MKDVYIKVGSKTIVLLEVLLGDHDEVPNPISFVDRAAFRVDSKNYERILSWSVFETTILVMFVFSFISNTFFYLFIF